MGSITTADKAVSTEEDPEEASGSNGDIEPLYKPEDGPEDIQERLYHNTCLEVAQLQAVLNQLVENKVEAIKQEAAATAQRTNRHKLMVMRLIRSPRAIVRRLKRRGSLSGDNKPEGESEQRQSGGRKRRKRITDDRGGNGGPHKGKRVNRQRIGSSSRPDSLRYNPGRLYHNRQGGGTPQHSDDDFVFLPSPCCCDTDGHTTVPVDPAFDSDYISVKIDDDDIDDDEDMVYVAEPEPLPYHLPHPEAVHPHQHHHHHHQNWQQSCGDIHAHSGGALPTLSGLNALGHRTDCSEEDEIKKAERLARRHRRRRRRKRRRKERMAAQHTAQGFRQLPPHLSAVAVSVDEVRVIDPDELSKKARLTIAATACLLLFMCLLLVGVTLRMAPLIDEMVREQNRDLLKSLQREPATTVQTPPTIAAPSQQQSQHWDAPPLTPQQQQQQLTTSATAAADAAT